MPKDLIKLLFTVLLIVAISFLSCNKSPNDDIEVSCNIVVLPYLNSNETAIDISIKNNTNKSILVDYRYYEPGKSIPDKGPSFISVPEKLFDVRYYKNYEDTKGTKLRLTRRKSEEARKGDYIMNFEVSEYVVIIPPQQSIRYATSVFDKNLTQLKNAEIKVRFVGRIAKLQKALNEDDFTFHFLTGKKLKPEVFMNTYSNKVDILSKNSCSWTTNN